MIGGSGIVCLVLDSRSRFAEVVLDLAVTLEADEIEQLVVEELELVLVLNRRGRVLHAVCCLREAFYVLRGDWHHDPLSAVVYRHETVDVVFVVQVAHSGNLVERN